MNEIRDFAELLVENGISCLPVNKSKKPLLAWSRLQRKLPEGAEIEKFNGAAGVALITGVQPGGVYYCIDVDVKGFEFYAKKILEEIDKALPGGYFDGEDIYIETSPSGGVHVIYRLDAYVAPPNSKYLYWPTGGVAVESRGEGGYVIVAPSPGYKVIRGDLTRLPKLIDREHEDVIKTIIDAVKLIEKGCFSPGESTNDPRKPKPVSEDIPKDPENLAVEWFNRSVEIGRYLLEKAGWSYQNTANGVERWAKPGAKNDTHATFDTAKIKIYIWSTNVGLPTNVYLSNYQFAALSLFAEDLQGLLDFVLECYVESDNAIVRIGSEYYKNVIVNGLPQLIPYSRQGVVDDGLNPKKIPALKTFVTEHNYLNYKRIVDNCYNLAHPLPYAPRPGEWPNTKALILRVFGEQYSVGIKYLQALICQPELRLPILCLISREQATGKTTFFNWILSILGQNATLLSPKAYTSDFTAAYANKSFVFFDEAFFEKREALEKLKNETTAKSITYHAKFRAPVQVKNYLHFGIASNDEDHFVSIDRFEQRYWIRKLSKLDDYDPNFLATLEKEIPAFLHYLFSLPKIDPRTRFAIAPEEYYNDETKGLKFNSMPKVARDLILFLDDYFLRYELTELKATVKDIKNLFFDGDRSVSMTDIRRAIKKHLGFEFSQVPVKYYNYANSLSTGRVYKITRDDINGLLDPTEPASTITDEFFDNTLEDNLPF